MSDLSSSWFEGVRRRLRCATVEPKRIVLMGPPGAGKGTQGALLAQKRCLCHIATGDLFRKEMKEKTALGLQIEKDMNDGTYISDDITIALLQKAMSQPACSKGFVLDGFPRTVPQAEKLDEMLREANTKVDHVFVLDVKENRLAARLAGRWVHPASGRSYHSLWNPPKVTGMDDETGEALVKRPDDDPKLLASRLSQYYEKTTPVISTYLRRYQSVDLKRFDASVPIPELHRLLSQSLE